MSQSELKARSYDDGKGGRKMLRFNEVTWKAVDLLAAARKLTWLEWAEKIPATHNNRHADIREAVIKSLLLLKSWKAAQPQEPAFNDSPLLGFMQKLSDAQLKEELASENTVIEAHIPGSGFTVRAGLRNGIDAIWIESHRPSGSSLVIPLPQLAMAHATSPEQAAAAQAAA